MGWYFLSPIFIDVNVQEDLPEEFIVEDIEDAEFDENLEDQDREELGTPKIVHSGDFEKVDYDVSGSYKIIENGDERLLRIDNLHITNGPDLHFVLSNSNQAFGNDDYEIISVLPGNQGSYNVSIPEGLNIDDYEYLLIHCVRFSHTFASANL